MPSQRTFWHRGGSMPFSVSSLADVLNDEFASRGFQRAWIGHAVWPLVPGTPTAADWLALLGVLSQHGPWIAHLREPQAKMGHLVVVVAVTQASVEILDSWQGGSSYHMMFDEFTDNVWTLEAVYLVRGWV
jgi:hypothetical protein